MVSSGRRAIISYYRIFEIHPKYFSRAMYSCFFGTVVFLFKYSRSGGVSLASQETSTALAYQKPYPGGLPSMRMHVGAERSRMQQIKYSQLTPDSPQPQGNCQRYDIYLARIHATLCLKHQLQTHRVL